MSNALQFTLSQRRQGLMGICPTPALLWSGHAPARNFPANVYTFRASSHFLYFSGYSLENAVLAICPDRTILYWDEASEDDVLWHGSMPTREDIGALMAVDATYPLDALGQWAKRSFATIPLVDGRSQQQTSLRNLPISEPPIFTEADEALAQAIVVLRMCHDDEAIAQIKRAAEVTVQGHRKGMQVTPLASKESEVRAAIESVFMAHNMTSAYGSIVTVHGEVLHHQHYHHALQPDDLLLVDAGAETELGWASDVTRTWPVSGKFSSTQREIYQGVLAAHDACIEAIAPGIEYREIHLLAVRKMAEMLVALGLLEGQVDSLIEQNIPAYFFPHGVGHLLGLDVHDMEDLGDRAGYALGRTRSDRLELKFLRLDRPLQERMIVTIEPGFYQIPQLLKQAHRLSTVNDAINWTRLEQFADVRGIRIEDDVLVTSDGAEVLTKSLPTSVPHIEAIINHGNEKTIQKS